MRAQNEAGVFVRGGAPLATGTCVHVHISHILTPHVHALPFHMHVRDTCPSIPSPSRFKTGPIAYLYIDFNVVIKPFFFGAYTNSGKVFKVKVALNSYSCRLTITITTHKTRLYVIWHMDMAQH